MPVGTVYCAELDVVGDGQTTNYKEFLSWKDEQSDERLLVGDQLSATQCSEFQQLFYDHW